MNNYHWGQFYFPQRNTPLIVARQLSYWEHENAPSSGCTRKHIYTPGIPKTTWGYSICNQCVYDGGDKWLTKVLILCPPFGLWLTLSLLKKINILGFRKIIIVVDSKCLSCNPLFSYSLDRILNPFIYIQSWV